MTAMLASVPAPTARQLPFNLDAERSVLGAIFIRQNTLDEAADLGVGDFFLPAHQRIFGAMRELFARGSVVDVLTVEDELRAAGELARLDGGSAYLLDCANAVPTAENAKHYIAIVMRTAVLRRLIAVTADIQSSAYGDFHEIQEFLAEVRHKIAGIDVPDQGGPALISEGLSDTMQSIQDRAANPSAHFLTTGLRGFDENIGGLRGGNLVVVAARPGMGKSALALDILLNAASKGIPSLLFSMEMNRMEIQERALAKRARVNGRKVVTGHMEHDEWHRLTRAEPGIASLPLWLDTRSMSAQRICSVSRRWFARQKFAEGSRKIAAIAVDYLGLVPSTGDEENRAHEIAAMTRAFKLLAGELDVPIILLAQLNRDGVKAARKPIISDLRDSGAIEQDANMVIFPWWEGTPNLQGRHPAQIIVGKNRGGPMGEVDVWWEPEFMTFSDEPQPYTPARSSYVDTDE